MIRIFNYPGCKANFIPQLDPLVSRTSESCSRYVEPFCGTASVLINSAGGDDFGIARFDSLHASDLSREVLVILSAFESAPYEALSGMYEDIRKEFGSIRVKENYYAFRDEYNKRHFGKGTENYYAFRDEYNKRHFGKGTAEEGFFLHIAARAAINSMFRIGPNGFNQASGLRGDSIALTQGEFGLVKSILTRADLRNADYRERFETLDSNETVWFLDPPYELRPVQGSYEGEDKFSSNEFLDAVSSLKGKIIYTDVYSEDIVNATGFKHSILSAKKNISPGRNQGSHDYLEAVYYNF